MIEVTEASRSNDKMKAVVETWSARPVPMWMDVNKDGMTVKMDRYPNRDEIDLEVAEHLIVELYSK